MDVCMYDSQRHETELSLKCSSMCNINKNIKMRWK